MKIISPRTLQVISFAFALLSVVGMTACVPGLAFPDFGIGTVIKPTTVALQPLNPTIQVSKVQQFSIVVTVNGDTNQVGDPSRFNWTSSQPTVATINDAGLATALAPGATTIKIVAKDDSSISAATVLTVSSGATALREVTGGASSIVFTVEDTSRNLGYSIDEPTGKLASYLVGSRGESQHTSTVALAPHSGPTWMAVHPSGKFLYVLQPGDNAVSTFSIDPWSGELNRTAPLLYLHAAKDSSTTSQVKPHWIAVDATGQNVVVEDFASRQIGFHINQSDGSLSAARIGD